MWKGEWSAQCGRPHSGGGSEIQQPREGSFRSVLCRWLAACANLSKSQQFSEPQGFACKMWGAMHVPTSRSC